MRPVTENLYQFFEERAREEATSLKPVKLQEKLEVLSKIPEACAEEEISPQLPQLRNKFKEKILTLEEETSRILETNSNSANGIITSNETELGSNRDKEFSSCSFRSF